MIKVILTDQQLDLLKQILATTKVPCNFGEDAANWHQLGMSTMEALENAEPEVVSEPLSIKKKA